MGFKLLKGQKTWPQPANTSAIKMEEGALFQRSNTDHKSLGFISKGTDPYNTNVEVNALQLSIIAQQA